MHFQRPQQFHVQQMICQGDNIGERAGERNDRVKKMIAQLNLYLVEMYQLTFDPKTVWIRHDYIDGAPKNLKLRSMKC